MVQHPWVMLESDFRSVQAVCVEKKNLEYGEGDRIVRWLALFNPKDIDLSQINFSMADYPKLVVLNMMGVSLADGPQRANDQQTEDLQKITRVRDFSELYRPEYLEEVFGKDAGEWVTTVYEFLQVGDPMSWPLNSWKAMMPNPVTDEAISDKELASVERFLVENNLVIKLSNGRMCTNPFVKRRLDILVNEEEKLILN
jgi:hypothetical protein